MTIPKPRKISFLAGTILPLLAACDHQAADASEATIETSASLVAGEDVPAGDARRVQILVVWGFLRARPEAAATVDWTGSIAVDNAALRVVGVDGKAPFEDGDVILRPRTDARSVWFESRTRGDADGLLLEVILAPALNPDDRPVTLSFNTAPFTDTLVIGPDMQPAQVKPVDDAGHVVAYTIVGPDSLEESARPE
jgi:hypothetical protein